MNLPLTPQSILPIDIIRDIPYITSKNQKEGGWNMSGTILKRCCIQATAIAIALLLTVAFAGQARAEMVYDLLITFTGAGTYEYHDISSERDFFTDVTLTFTWTSKYHLLLSEDFARTCANTEDSCYTGWISMPEIQVNGTLDEQWKDYNGLQNCSSNIASAGPGSTFVTSALASLTSPGDTYYFAVDPFGDVEFASNLCTSYGDFWGVMDQHLLAATDILPASALTQGKIAKPVWGGADQIQCGDRCTSSVAWVGNLTIEKLAAYGQSGNPAPPIARLFSYQPSVFPVINNFLFDAQPIGLGPVADGGNTLDFRVGFGGYPEPLDLYLAVYMPFLASPNLWMVGPGSSFQPFTQNLVKWKENVTGAVNETILGSIPTSVLPAGQYYFYLMATPAGSLDSYYLWGTSFTR